MTKLIISWIEYRVTKMGFSISFDFFRLHFQIKEHFLFFLILTKTDHLCGLFFFLFTFSSHCSDVFNCYTSLVIVQNILYNLIWQVYVPFKLKLSKFLLLYLFLVWTLHTLWYLPGSGAHSLNSWIYYT